MSGHDGYKGKCKKCGFDRTLNRSGLCPYCAEDGRGKCRRCGAY